MEKLHDSLAPVPEDSRVHKVSGQFWIWAGANIAPINWILGALGIKLGLGLWETVYTLVLGNIAGTALFGLFSVIGQKTGVTGMVWSKQVFGIKGAWLPSSFQAILSGGWCAVNTWIVLDLVVELLDQLGLVDAHQSNLLVKSLVAALLMAIQVAISWWGYKAIAAFERWTVPPTVVILFAMTVVAWTQLDVDWNYSGQGSEYLSVKQRIGAISVVLTAIGIGWGITWLTYAGDYSRFISNTVSKKKVFLASSLGQFIPVVWLGVLGTSLATVSRTADPGQLIAGAFGSWSVLVLALVLHGPLATNILNIYTFSVTVKSIGIRISRRALTLGLGFFSYLVVLLFVMYGSFAEVIDSFLVSIVGWVTPWAAIVLVHWTRKGRFYCMELSRGPVKKYGNCTIVSWPAVSSFVVGLVAVWCCMYGTLPAFQGPVARWLGGIDVSWLGGGLVTAVCYIFLSRMSESSRKLPVRVVSR